MQKLQQTFSFLLIISFKFIYIRVKALPIEPNLFPCKLSESHTNKNFLLQFFLSIYIPIKLKSIRASCLFKLFTFSLTFFVPSHFTLFKSQKTFHFLPLIHFQYISSLLKKKTSPCHADLLRLLFTSITYTAQVHYTIGLSIRFLIQLSLYFYFPINFEFFSCSSTH